MTMLLLIYPQVHDQVLLEFHQVVGKPRPEVPRVFGGGWSPATSSNSMARPGSNSMILPRRMACR